MVGLMLPGETALVVAGFGVQQGWIALWPMVAIAVGSAALGDSVGCKVAGSARALLRRELSRRLKRPGPTSRGARPRDV